MILLSVFAVVSAASDSSDASRSDGWACRITVDGTSLTTTYSNDGGAFQETTRVQGTISYAGSWGFGKDGYGPFGSYYAAFDPTDMNRLVCRLDPSDLSKSVDGTDISGNGYNIMWCLPRIYLSVEGNTITLAGNDSYGGTLAPAYTIGGDDYDCLALGVYEATSDGTVLGSVSGTLPQNNTSLNDFRSEAKANTMTDGSLSQLWNFHQWELYRLCSLAVTDNFDSQAQVGYGNCAGDNGSDDPRSRTGAMDARGPYYGTAEQSDEGVKLFIENAWGSLSLYIDDACLQDGVYVGQNTDPTFDYDRDNTIDKVRTSIPEIGGYGTLPYSLDLTTWGLPTAATKERSTETPDSFYTWGSEYVLVTGGDRAYSDEAGLSFLMGDGIYGSSYIGTRLAFLFHDETEEEKHPVFIPILPDPDGGIEIFVKDDGEPWLGENGKTILLIAVIATIIAELAALNVSRRR